MLRLRPYKPSDAAKIVAWVSDWDGFSAWCADLLDWPLTEASLEKLRPGSSAHTLTVRRIRAFRIALALIGREMERGAGPDEEVCP